MKKYIIIATLAVIALSGCSLEQKPFLSQSNDMALIDFNGINKATAGAYAPLVDATWYGADFVLHSELRAENATRPVNTDFQSGRYVLPFNMSYAPEATSGLWSAGYYVISAANNVIEAVETAGVEAYLSKGVEEQDIYNVLAECYFLRALSHFDLVRQYGYSVAKVKRDPSKAVYGVPVILKTDKTGTLQPKRDSVETVYRQIISDLLYAEEIIDPDYERGSVASKRAAASIGAIQALLSRVYLYHQDYQEAADYATKVIENPMYEMWTEEEYPSVWAADKGDGEVIFEVYGLQTNDYDAYWEGPSHMTNPKGYADCAASPVLVAIYGENDVRGTQGVRGEDDGKVMFCTDEEKKSNGELWTMKYQGKGFGDAVQTPDQSNTVVIRLSEMYLNRAEAIVNGAVVKGVTAKDDINVIRSNRGVAPEVTEPNVATVLSERRKELCFEGHYWYDVARTDGEISYKDERRPSIILDKASMYWALPIPKREFNVNENLEQNPGYIK